MQHQKPFHIQSIAEVHRLMGLPKPQHPLIGLIDVSMLNKETDVMAVIFDFYVVSMKRGCDKLIYGQQKYDFDEGLMAFLAPGQILRGEEKGVPPNLEGWMLFIHPDFLWGSSLASKIRQYEYFDYATNEALFLSDREESVINGIIGLIKNEYQSNIDKFSQDVILAQLELLFTYAQRFYERQFITRKITNNKLLIRLADLLDHYFGSDQAVNGLPTVQFLADSLHLSTKYLSSLLKQLTGQSTQQIIHEKLIEKAKEQLSSTGLSVSEIAYSLGFEHSQSFSKLFKSKTKQSPLEFRSMYN